VLARREAEGGTLRASLAKAELNIQLLYTEAAEKAEEMRQLNKAREELRSHLEEREHYFATFDQRMDDREEQVKEVNRQIDELDMRREELEEKVKTLE
jgi:chromosome segregation ATPase